MRVVVPDLGTFEGTAEEIADALARLRANGLIAGSPATISVAHAPRPRELTKAPTNEHMIYEFRLDKGVSKKTRTRYVGIVEEFERIILPKSFLDASQNDVREYERRLLDNCTNLRTSSLSGGVRAPAPRSKCALGLFTFTPVKPASCCSSCPKFARQTSGPRSRLQGLKVFYDFLRERGLVQANPVDLILARHSRSLPQRSGRKKYAPSAGDVQLLVWAARQVSTPREVAIIMALAKWGRRPLHVAQLHAADLRGILTPDPEGHTFVDFQGVRERVAALNANPRTKLNENLLSVIDNELATYLRDVYMPYRQEKWGYAWNEGPLFPRLHRGDELDETLIQREVLDPALDLLSRRGTAAERAKWTAHKKDKRVRITPGCFRHFFSTTLKQFGVQDLDIDIQRGDIIRGSKRSYIHIAIGDLVATYRMHALLAGAPTL